MCTSDYEEVAALWESSPGVGIYPGDDRETIARFLDRNPGLSFVGRDDTELVGAVLCSHDGRRGYITHLAVDAAFRRHGIGRALVERCLDALRREGIAKAHLFVFRTNREAQAFWRRVGWHERDDLVTMSIYLTGERRGGGREDP
jgi:ribosomal protein S18 acetylase RimI-like enzyme